MAAACCVEQTGRDNHCSFMRTFDVADSTGGASTAMLAGFRKQDNCVTTSQVRQCDMNKASSYMVNDMHAVYC